MKKIIKLTLAVTCVMFSTSLFAQKFARINMQEIVMAMPEFEQIPGKGVEAEKLREAHLRGIPVGLLLRFEGGIQIHIVQQQVC